MRRYSVVLVELYEKARGHGRWNHRRPDPLQFNQTIAFHHPKGTRKAWNLAPAVLGQFGERPGLKFAQQSQQPAVLIAQYCGQGRQGGEGYRPLRNLRWCRSVLSFSADDTTSEGTVDWRTARIGICHRCEIALGPIDHVWPSTRWIEQTAHGWRIWRSVCRCWTGRAQPRRIQQVSSERSTSESLRKMALAQGRLVDTRRMLWRL